MGIRPEDFSSGGDLVLPIELVEPTGSDTHVVFRLGEIQVTAVFHDRIMKAVGDVLSVSLGGRVHLFDPASSKRIMPQF